MIFKHISWHIYFSVNYEIDILDVHASEHGSVSSVFCPGQTLFLVLVPGIEHSWLLHSDQSAHVSQTGVVAIIQYI